MDRRIVSGAGQPKQIGPYSQAVRRRSPIWTPCCAPAAAERPRREHDRARRRPELKEVYGEFFPTDPPARMTMEVLLPRGLLISIGCTPQSSKAETRAYVTPTAHESAAPHEWWP
jgi:hypothetical protein